MSRRSVLIVLLAAASGFMAYRLFVQGGISVGTPPQGRQAPGSSGASAAAGGAGSASRSASGRGAEAEIDPTLRLDLLNNSRAVSYTGSRRNIFVIGAAATKDGNGSSGSNAPGGNSPGGAAPTVVELPPPPPPPPPVVIPLKFYGIAERSGGALTKALLTSGDTILIAQVGQTVAQHFKITRIGLAKLELEDIRDHSTHEIPLEEGAAGSAPPAAAAVVPR